MKAVRKPAEGFPVGEYIKDEIEAREWSVGHFAQLVTCFQFEKEYGINQLAIEFMLNCSRERGMRMGEMAPWMAKALGVNPQFLLNLEKAWIEYEAQQEAQG